MSVFDAIKKSVLEGFDTSISTADIFLGLGVSLLAGLFILLIYRRYQADCSVSGGFCLTLLLLSSVSAMIVLTITSNLALSLGMVGALSIVRFRTAVKDASDTAFLFWAVAAGVTAGAGFYLITLIGCLFVGAICVVSVLVLENWAKAYLLVVRAENGELADRIEETLAEGRIKYKLSAMTQSSGYTEMIYELAYSQEHKSAVNALGKLTGVKSVSLVDCRKN